MSSRLIGRTRVSKIWGKRSNRLGSTMTYIVMPNSKSGSNPEGSSWQRGWVNQRLKVKHTEKAQAGWPELSKSQPSQPVASFFAMSASIAFWTIEARCSLAYTVARTEQSSFVRICHSVMSCPGATEQMTLLRCVFSMIRIISKA